MAIKTDQELNTLYVEEQTKTAKMAYTLKPIIPNSYKDIINITMQDDEDDDVAEFRMYDLHGQASYIRQGQDKTHRVGETLKVENFYSHTLGIDVYIGDSEISKARKRGLPLSKIRIEAAYRAIDKSLESLIAIGDPLANSEGLVNQSALTPTLLVPNQNKMAALSRLGIDCYYAIADAIEDMENDSYGVSTPNTMLLPFKTLSYLKRVHLNPGQNSETALTRLQSEYPNIRFKKWRFCDGNGLDAALAPANRAVLYQDDEEKITHRVGHLHKNTKFQQNFHEQASRFMYKTFGLIVLDETAIRYLDDV